MPGSLPNPLIYFPAKAVIYSLAGWALNRVYKAGPNPLLFGVLRVALGFGLGFALFVVMMAMATSDGSGPPTSQSDHLWLISTRLLVWAGMVWLFYERKGLSPLRFFIVV